MAPTSDEKLRELILFISERSEGDQAFGAVKLNKLLFYADFVAYMLFGKSISEQSYQKLKHGPAPRRLVPVRDQMESDGELAVRKVEFHSKRQHRSLALREANLSVFTPDEVDLVSQLIRSNWGKNGTEMSDMSHRFHGWKLAREGETIPYQVALVGKRDLTDEEIEWGMELAEAAEQWPTQHA